MRKLPVFLVGIALLGVACGDDDDSADQGSASTSTAASEATGGATTEATSGEAPVALEGQVNNEGTGEIEGDEMEVELDDFYFGPTFIKGKPGATVHLELENEGDNAHTFTSDTLGVDQEVAAGEKAEVDVTLPAEKGAVQFHCRFHEDRGMQGAFFFKEGDTVMAAGGTTGSTGTTAGGESGATGY